MSTCDCGAAEGTARSTCYYEGGLICVCVCHITLRDERWRCGHCDELTDRTHFRQGADGVMFHANADAPPSDDTIQPQNLSRGVVLIATSS